MDSFACDVLINPVALSLLNIIFGWSIGIADLDGLPRIVYTVDSV